MNGKRHLRKKRKPKGIERCSSKSQARLAQTNLANVIPGALHLCDPEIWREAGVLSGTLARTHGYGREQRRRVLNDALLFASARKYGCAVLSRNVRDFHLLQQLDPSGRVMFYKLGAEEAVRQNLARL
jgi:predicted nucleic acid-binding protein